MSEVEMSELAIRIDRLIEEVDYCLELLGYEREALERMEDGYEEHLRYGVFPGNLEDEG